MDQRDGGDDSPDSGDEAIVEGEAADLEEDAEFDQAVEAQEPRKTRRRWAFVAVAVIILAGLGVALGLVVSGGGTSASSPAGPEGVPIAQVPDLASAGTTATGTPVDGITCRTSNNQVVKYHIHVHLAVYVKGQERRLPAGVGIPAPQLHEHLSDGLFIDNGVNSCLYWLHDHAYDDIIHVESPYKHTFTLGQFFDIWRQPLGPDQVGPAKGHVVAFVNGTQFNGNPKDVPLLPHAVVQLDVGTPVVPFHVVHFKVSGLCSSNSSCATKLG